jgi:hypothetical protein
LCDFENGKGPGLVTPFLFNNNSLAQIESTLTIPDQLELLDVPI